METNTKVNIKRVSFMEEASIFGQMDLRIKDNSNRA
jgi:hypothetical protein